MRKNPIKLSIGMAVYDEYEALYFTLEALRLYHSEVMDRAEIIVIDNNPKGRYALRIRNLVGAIGGEYVPFEEKKSTSVRDLVFRKARGEIVLCMDPHVFIEAGALAKLIDYFDTHPDCGDLIQGPMLYDTLDSVTTHMNPIWSAGMYGQFGTDNARVDATEPYEIDMHGLGVFCCRRDAWLGFNPRMIGFGGEEGYIHEKYRQAGHKTINLPFLRWLHRFFRVNGATYTNQFYHRIRNYHIGFEELELDTKPIDDHFEELLGKDTYKPIRQKIEDELNNPLSFFDAIYCINLDTEKERWETMQERFRKLGIDHMVRRFPSVRSHLENHHLGCALSHRRIVERARLQNLETVLVFEDDAMFNLEFSDRLVSGLCALEDIDWKLLYLGGNRCYLDCDIESKADLETRLSKHLIRLEPGATLSTTHAIAYHERVYEEILDTVPDNLDDMKTWALRYSSIDFYFMYHFTDRYLIDPMISVQVQEFDSDGSSIDPAIEPRKCFY